MQIKRRKQRWTRVASQLKILDVLPIRCCFRIWCTHSCSPDSSNSHRRSSLARNASSPRLDWSGGCKSLTKVWIHFRFGRGWLWKRVVQVAHRSSGLFLHSDEGQLLTWGEHQDLNGGDGYQESCKDAELEVPLVICDFKLVWEVLCDWAVAASDPVEQNYAF